MTQRPGSGRSPGRPSSSRSGPAAPGGPASESRRTTTGRGPRRPPPRRVFWVRRALALIVVAVVVLLAVLVVRALLPDSSSASTGPGEGAGAGSQPVVAGSTATTTPRTTTPSPSPTPTASGVIGSCGAPDVAATVIPTAGEFAWGAKVTFTVTIRNVAAGPCVVDGSNKARAVVVSSGGKVVWSSATCTSGERLLLLGPGDVDTQKVTWDRTRTATGCGKHGTAAGTGSYDVATTLLGTASGPVTFTLAPKEAPSPSPAGGATAASSPASATKATAKPGATPTATPGAATKPSTGSTASPTSHPSASHPSASHPSSSHPAKR